MFAEPSDTTWDIVTDVLTTYDTASDWPGWLMPVAPGIAAELLDDGLAATKPRWQARLLDIALRALSEPLPVDLTLVARGLAIATINPAHQKVALAAMKRALDGTESSRYAASQIARSSPAITPSHTASQLVADFAVRSGRVKGRHRLSAYDLLKSDVLQLGAQSATPVLHNALEELKTLQVLDIGDQTVGIRPKNLTDWAGLVTAIEDSEGHAALELAVKAAEPRHWRLIHLIALELFPALARRPTGTRVLDTDVASFQH